MSQLKQLHPNLYVGELPFRLAGVEIGSRMTVMVLPDGLLVHSPIELEPFQAEIDAIGPVRYLVAPNKYHYLHLAEWLQAYPECRAYAAPGVKPRHGISIHQFLGDAPISEWQPHVEHTLFQGSTMTVEAILFHPESRTLVLTDTAMNIPASRDALTQFVAGTLGVRDNFSPSRVFKSTLKDKVALRATLDRIFSWDFDRVVISHGDMIETGGQAALRAAYAFALD